MGERRVIGLPVATYLVRCCLACLLLLPAAASPVPAQDLARLTGIVTDASARARVPAAEVLVRETGLTTITDSAGAFDLPGIPAGTHTVEVKATGYASVQVRLEFGSGQSRHLELALVPAPLPLPGVSADAERRGQLGGFWERRERKLGYYVTRQEIEERNPRLVVDLFRSMPGVKLYHMDGQGGGTIVSFGRSDHRMVCSAAVFLNGVPFDPLEQGMDVFRPDEIEAIEAYPGPASLPAQFSATTARRRAAGSGGLARVNYTVSPGCGVILLWTRVGGVAR